jgi:hypothetical protein
MQPKLIITFERLAEPVFLTKSELISNSVNGNVNFPLPWPPAVPPPATLASQFAAYQSAYNAAEGGDSGKIQLRIAARDALTLTLKKIAPYLEIVANGSVAILQTTGYDLRHDSNVTVVSGDLPAPGNFTVARGKMSGQLLVSCAALTGAHGYLIQWTTGDPTVEANWTNSLNSGVCRNVPIPGLTPGKIYWVRMAGIGHDGPGAWTNATSIMVV